MKCAELMTPEIEHCSIGDRLDAVARRMRDGKLAFVAVCDASGAIVGGLSDQDLGRDGVREKVVEAVMSNDLVCCAPDDELEIARDLMRRFGKSRVVCVDDSLRPIGFISGIDIFWVSAARGSAVAAPPS